MGRTLSQDLRDRVVAAIDSGLSCRAAAARFGVSVSSAIRWRRRALDHGQAVAKPLAALLLVLLGLLQLLERDQIFADEQLSETSCWHG